MSNIPPKSPTASFYVTNNKYPSPVQQGQKTYQNQQTYSTQNSQFNKNAYSNQSPVSGFSNQQSYSNQPQSYSNQQPSYSNQPQSYSQSYSSERQEQCDKFVDSMYFEIKSTSAKNGQCLYTIHKSKENICQIDLMFEAFDMRDPTCQRDYLSVNGERLCGNLPRDTVRSYKFKPPNMNMHLYMKMESGQSYMSIRGRQVECAPSQFRQDPEQFSYEFIKPNNGKSYGNMNQRPASFSTSQVNNYQPNEQKINNYQPPNEQRINNYQPNPPNEQKITTNINVGDRPAINGFVSSAITPPSPLPLPLPPNPPLNSGVLGGDSGFNQNPFFTSNTQDSGFNPNPSFSTSFDQIPPNEDKITTNINVGDHNGDHSSRNGFVPAVEAPPPNPQVPSSPVSNSQDKPTLIAPIYPPNYVSRAHLEEIVQTQVQVLDRKDNTSQPLKTGYPNPSRACY